MPLREQRNAAECLLDGFSEIPFGARQADLTVEAREMLYNAAELLKYLPKLRVTLEGHTGGSKFRPEGRRNELVELSRVRSEVVKAAMLRLGVRNKISCNGNGGVLGLTKGMVKLVIVDAARKDLDVEDHLLEVVAKAAAAEAAAAERAAAKEAKAAPRPVREDIQVGVKVVIKETFQSDNVYARVELQKGQVGKVLQVDKTGDIKVKFADHMNSGWQWILQKNLDKLDVTGSRVRRSLSPESSRRRQSARQLPRSFSPASFSSAPSLSRSNSPPTPLSPASALMTLPASEDDHVTIKAASEVAEDARMQVEEAVAEASVCRARLASHRRRTWMTGMSKLSVEQLDAQEAPPQPETAVKPGAQDARCSPPGDGSLFDVIACHLERLCRWDTHCCAMKGDDATCMPSPPHVFVTL